MKKHSYSRLFLLIPALVSMVLAEFAFVSGKQFIFSSYMVGDILLILITAPLFVLSLVDRPGGLTAGISRRLTAIPWMNWIIGVGIMWLWNVPGVFNALLTAEGRFGHGHLHFLAVMHTGSLLTAGIVFCWPLAGPFPAHRLSPPESILYLTTATVACSILGLLIEFTSPGHFGTSIAAVTRVDQQWAGLIMWAPCCIVYFLGVIYLLRKWMGEGLYRSHDFYRRVPKRRPRTAGSDGALGTEDGLLRRRGGVVLPQLGIPDPADHLV